MRLTITGPPPVSREGKGFPEYFREGVQSAEQVVIAVGYVSEESVAELKSLLEASAVTSFKLLVGMHFFEGITRQQYQALELLQDYLDKESLGEVYVSTVCKYHGKVYLFAGPDCSSAVGSSNLDGILEGRRVCEADVFIEDAEWTREAMSSINNLIAAIGTPLREWRPESFAEKSAPLEGQEGVEKISQELVREFQPSGVSFELPLKGDDATRSNLNTYFGEGRRDARGIVKPRHWYEVELIVPNSVTSQPAYPQAGAQDSTLTVVTDDGWKFNCKISGQASKNFRSEGDLRVLGKWIKGRLEQAGVLKVGEPVTDQTLEDYGRATVTLTKTTDSDIWLLDFSV